MAKILLGRLLDLKAINSAFTGPTTTNSACIRYNLKCMIAQWMAAIIYSSMGPFVYPSILHLDANFTTPCYYTSAAKKQTSSCCTCTSNGSLKCTGTTPALSTNFFITVRTAAVCSAVQLPLHDPGSRSFTGFMIVLYLQMYPLKNWSNPCKR